MPSDALDPESKIYISEVLMQFALRDLTIGEVLSTQATRHRDKPCLVFETASFSYQEVELETNRLANGLGSAGVDFGDHVACMLGNGPEILLSIFALGKLGAVAVPLNTSARGKGLAYYLDHADSTTLIADAQFLPHIAAIIHLTSSLKRLIIVGEPPAGADLPADLIVLKFNDLRSSNTLAPKTEVKYNDQAFLMYTSGTTGPSKAVMYTHAYALTWAGGFADAHSYRSDDIMYVSMPLFHGNALHSATYGCLLVGATVVVKPKFSASNFWRDIYVYGATLTNLLGSMGDILWNLDASEYERKNTLRQIMAGPIPDRGRQMEERWHVQLVSCFGLTDFGVSNFSTVDDPPDKFGSCGLVSSHFEVRIVDDDDFEVPDGQLGEIVLRTKTPWHSASGYYKMPTETANSLRNQWFHTGDLGIRDADGFLYFKDRKKDAIRRRGENISAFEVEQVLMDYEGISEVCAYAVAIDGDEEVGVSLITTPGHNFVPADLIKWCEGRMSYFMVPRFIDTREDLPRTESGKIQKHSLRKDAQSNVKQLWDRVSEGIEVGRL
jgi:carnitine-CoA ligase